MRAGLCVIVCVLMAGCSSTRVVSDRMIGTVPTPPPAHVCALAISSRADVRATLEGALKQQLEARGYQATAMHALLLDLPEHGDGRREALVQGASRAGCEAVLLVSLLTVDVRQDWQAARMEPVTVTSGSGLWGFGAYYDTWQEYVFVPGYYEQSSEYHVLSQLFTEDTIEPVWESETSTLNPQGLERAAKGYARALVDLMIKRGVVGQQ